MSLRLQAVGDEDEAGHDVAGLLGDDVLGHRHRRRPVVAAAEVDGRLQGAGAGVGGVELEGAGRVRRGGVEVLDLEGELGEGDMGLGEVGAELDELLVLGEGVAGRALVAEEAGEAQPRLGMVGVQAEDVAELDRRPLLVAVLEVGEGALVVGFGALRAAVAAGERDGEEEGAEEGEAHGTDSGFAGPPGALRGPAEEGRCDGPGGARRSARPGGDAPRPPREAAVAAGTSIDAKPG